MKNNKQRILIIDDEKDILELLSITLRRMNIDPVQARDVKEAKRLLKSQHFDACLTDLRLPDGTGIDIVRYIQSSSPNMPVVVISAHGNMESAINALKAGALDFISKPIDLNKLRSLIDTAISLESHGDSTKKRHKLLGTSPEIEVIRQQISKLARSMAPVYIHGESGTGKELVARLIHESGPHSDKPFIAVNCSAIPPELMESEFFGHKKGSFTGAISDSQGLFRAANGGTLFLDEIADLPTPMQAKLLRAIQERSIRPVGDTREVSITCRILSASHKNLSELVNTDKFREDLYYRINVIKLDIPPLRTHKEDIPVLIEHILTSISDRNLSTRPSLDESALTILMDYSFPGNIRELENILEGASALCEQGITGDDILPLVEAMGHTSTDRMSDESLDDYMQRIERNMIEKAIKLSGNNKTRAAKLLGISFRSLRYKLKKLDIE